MLTAAAALALQFLAVEALHLVKVALVRHGFYGSHSLEKPFHRTTRKIFLTPATLVQSKQLLVAESKVQRPIPL